MSSPPLSKPLRGIVPPMITPLSDRDTLDADGLQRLVEHLIDGGVHGLFILGSSGEAPSLSYRLRREVIQQVCTHVAGRLPVLVGVTDTSMQETLALAQYAADVGATAAVLAPPYYFPLNQTELTRYVRGVVAELPSPLVLYNMPRMTKVTFEPETVRQLLDEPRIIGLKDSSRQIDYFRAVREVTRQRPDWSLLVGFEHMLVETIEAGGDGGVCGGANLSPRLLVDFYEAAVSGDQERIDRLQQRLSIQGKLYTIGTGSTPSLQGIKCALSLRGIIGQDRMSEPHQGLNADQRAQVEAVLGELDKHAALPHDTGGSCSWRTPR